MANCWHRCLTRCTALSILFSAALANGQSIGPPDVVTTALKIVAGIHGSFKGRINYTPNRTMPGGPLIGNGDLGVVMGGRYANQPIFYFGKTDFYGVLRGRMMPLAHLALNIPALRGGEMSLRENIGPGTITGTLRSSHAALAIKSWVTPRHNLMVLQMRNLGGQKLTIQSTLLDAWNTPGIQAIRLHGKDFSALHVAPDSVQVYLGNRVKMGADSRGQKPVNSSFAFAGRIAKVTLFRRAETRDGLPPKSDVFATWHLHILPPHAIRQASVVSSPHGAAGSFTGSQRGMIRLGVLRIPQRQFAISAWVDVTKPNENSFIFTAMANPYWPRRFPYHRGFSLRLKGGCFEAKLNRTAVTSTKRLPINQWVHLAASYDGRALTIYINGRRAGTTTAFPTAPEVMGADKGSIHTGDSHLPFNGCGPQGIIMQRVLGAIPTQKRGTLTFTIPADSAVDLLVAAVDDHQTAEYQAAATQLIQSADVRGLSRLYARHTRWWNKFWSRSFIEIPDKLLENQWYGSLYVLACCSEPGDTAPGLWGNFITSRMMGWQGDYTLDYNFEAPFWAACPTNHAALADNYDSILLNWMPRGRAIAKQYGQHGLYYFTQMTPVPGWSDDPSHFLGQKCGAVFAAVDCIQRWRYTRKAAYAKKIWPYLTGVADFWDHYLQLQNGLYVDVNDAADEGFHRNDVNPAVDLAFIHLLYQNLIPMSRQLHKSAAQRRHWADILAHLSPLPVASPSKVNEIYVSPPARTLTDLLGTRRTRGKLVLRFAQKGTGWANRNYALRFGPRKRAVVTSSSAGMDSLQAVFPGWQIGLESSPRMLKAGRDTTELMRIWYDANDSSSFYPAAADVGYNPENIMRHLHTFVQHNAFPNFAYNIHNGGIENEATVPVTLCAMLVQSYQKNIRLFPDWPQNRDARFGNLLACGNFLISSAMRAGHVAYVQIISNAGRPLRLSNPWPKQSVHYQIVGGKQGTLSGAVLMMPTHAGEIISLRAGR